MNTFATPTTEALPTREQLAERILNAPTYVERAAEVVLRARESLADLTQRLELLRLATAETVAAELGPDGKPAYGNETKRATETARRLELLPEAAELAQYQRDAKHTLSLAEITLRAREDEFRALRSVAALLAPREA